MQHKIIMSSGLGTDCWSTLKFFNKCHECNRVAYCKLPEAKEGRVILDTNKIAEATEELTKCINNLEKELECLEI